VPEDSKRLYRVPGQEQKVAYQKSMLIAIGFEVVVVVVVVVAFKFNKPQPLPEKVISTSSQMVRVVEPDKGQSKPARSIGYNPYAQQHTGFMGFKGFHVISDAPEPLPIRPHKVFVNAPIPLGSDTIESYSDIEGDGTGVYPPGDYVLIEPKKAESTIVSDSIVIVPCNVLVAVKPEYPFVAQDAGKEGVAAIIVCIDETGKVSLFSDEIKQSFSKQHLQVENMSFKVDGTKRLFNYVVKDEKPDGYFFAKKVAEILPQWSFAPSMVKGQPVKSLIVIAHAFCLSDACTNEYSTNRNYQQYPK